MTSKVQKQNIEFDFSEVGRTGLRRWGGQLFEEFLTDLRGQRGVKIFREMKDNNPVVGSMLFAFEFLARQVSWRIEPSGESEEEVALAEFIESALFQDMETHWNDVLSEIFSMLWAGWAWLEIVYKRRAGESDDPTKASKFTDNKIGWRKWALRSQDTLYEWQFHKERKDDIEALVQQITDDPNLLTIPISKSLLFRTRMEKNNPEGRSLLRNAYRPWYYSKRIEELMGIGIERDLAGMPMLKPPDGLDLWNTKDAGAVTKKAQAEKLVRSIKRDEQEGIVLPHGWELTLLSASGRRQFDLVSILNYYDQRIAMVMLADFILLGHEKVGSFALASSKTHMFSMALGGVLDIVAEIINRDAIPKLLKLNSIPVDKIPLLKHGDVETIDLKELGAYVVALSGTGITLDDERTVRYLREQAKLPMLDPEEEEDKLEREGAMEQLRETILEMRTQLTALQNQNGNMGRGNQLPGGESQE